MSPPNLATSPFLSSRRLPTRLRLRLPPLPLPPPWTATSQSRRSSTSTLPIASTARQTGSSSPVAAAPALPPHLLDSRALQPSPRPRLRYENLPPLVAPASRTTTASLGHRQAPLRSAPPPIPMESARSSARPPGVPSGAPARNFLRLDVPRCLDPANLCHRSHLPSLDPAPCTQLPRVASAPEMRRTMVRVSGRRSAAVAAPAPDSALDLRRLLSPVTPENLRRRRHLPSPDPASWARLCRAASAPEMWRMTVRVTGRHSAVGPAAPWPRTWPPLWISRLGPIFLGQQALQSRGGRPSILSGSCIGNSRAVKVPGRCTGNSSDCCRPFGVGACRRPFGFGR